MTRDNTMPGYRTNVRKVGKKWRVSYCLPYSGHLYVELKSWRKAMDEAWKIEEYRQWA